MLKAVSLQGVVLVLSLFFFQSTTFAASKIDPRYTPKIQCLQRGAGGDQWRACVHIYPNSGNKVLYYFNGLGGDENTWKKSPFEMAIMKRWIDSGTPPPIVVTISFETFILHKLIWFMVEKNSSRFSGRFEKVVNEVMPLVKQKIFPNLVVEENLLMGVSMGGFNATQLYFKYPIFAKAALICVPASVTAPQDGKAAQEAYIARTRASKNLANLASSVAWDYMPTREDWVRNSPLELSLKYLSPISAPLYLANGTSDDFGFHEGDMFMARIAYAKGAPVTSHFYKGREHCGVEPNPIADFFTGTGDKDARTADEVELFPDFRKYKIPQATGEPPHRY